LAGSIRTALAAAVLGALLTGCGAAIVPQIHNDSDRITVARRLYDKGEYAIVVEVLNAYTTTGTGSADIDQAVYLLGNAYLMQKDYSSAQTQFERIARDYPESDSATAASYRLGQALYGQSRSSDFDQEFTLKALSQWQRTSRDAPGSDWATLAEQRIAECRTRLARKLWRSGDLYVKQNLYEPALVYYRSVITDYSDTPVLGDALIGLAVADARLGRKDTALVVLRDLETRFAGRELGLRAAKVRTSVERWPAAGDTKHRRHRSVEAVQPVPQTSSTTPTTPFGP
jgi:outer membrane protein assembly factor BamD